MELVIATGNEGKLREIERELRDFSLTLRRLSEFNALPDVIEDGDSFEANALKKAREMATYLDKLVLADDSGLEVTALNGRPGVYSARFAGPDATDADNNAKLLEAMQGVSHDARDARFVCVMALVDPRGEELVVRGECVGHIIDNPRGHGGFGYDPLFEVDAHDKTFAELDPAQKARLSHRGQALISLKNHLPEFLKS